MRLLPKVGNSWPTTTNSATRCRHLLRLSLLDAVRNEMRQFHTDVDSPRRISTGAPTCECRADRCEGERATKLVRVHPDQRLRADPAQPAQSEQEGGLKAVACPDGIHDLDRGCLDFNQTRFSMPCLSSLDSTRDDDKACARRDE